MLLDWIVPEVLEIIISYLPTHHEVLRFSLTCKDLNDLCSAPTVWRELCFKMFRLPHSIYAAARHLGMENPESKYCSTDERWRMVHTALASAARQDEYIGWASTETIRWQCAKDTQGGIFLNYATPKEVVSAIDF